MLETLLTMILKIVLEWLRALLVRQVSAAIDKAKKDNINLENSEAYKKAQSRLEKIEHAKHLLNRTTKP